MQKEDFATRVISDINTIRTNPNSVVKRFQTLKTGLTRFKGSEGMIKELDTFIKILTNSNGVDAMEVSNELCRAAERQIELFAINRSYEPKVDPEELDSRCRKFVRGFSKIFQVSDDGGEQPTDSVNRLVMSKLDKEKQNRKILLDSSLKFIGVAHRKMKEDNVVVIICADYVEPAVFDKPTVDAIMDYLNGIRTRPIEFVHDFEVMLPALKNKKPQANEVNYVINYLNNIKTKPLHALHGNDLLRDFATQVMENLDTIKTEDDLKALASKSYSGFSNLSFYTTSGETNGEKIVTDILLDPVPRRNFLENLNMKLIGVIHNDKIENSPPVTVLIVADDIDEGQPRTFEEKFINEINRLRSNPSSFVNQVNNYKNNLKKYWASSRKNFIRELDGLVGDLKKNIGSLPNVVVHDGLNFAAQEHFDHLEQANVKNFYPQDEEYLQISLAHYISGFTLCSEFINTGAIRIEDVILEFLVSEYDTDRGSRKALLNKELLYAGVAHGVIRGKRLTILILTDNAEDLTPKPFLEGFLEEINNIRAHPRSYVKFIQKVIDEAKYPEGVKTKIEKDSYMQDLYQLLFLLRNTRTFGPFAVNEDLTSAAEARLKEFVEDSRVRRSNLQDLQYFLSDFGGSFLNVGQLQDMGSETPRDLLINLLIDPNDIDKINRKVILTKKLNLIGIARSADVVTTKGEEQTVSNPNITVAVFADKFDPTVEKTKISVHTHRRKLRRPLLTDDEILQIKKDFKLFDVLNYGSVKPEDILYFMDNSPNYSERNPIYYEAFKQLNTTENNSNRVNVEEFLNTVKKIILSYHSEQRWYELFKLYYGNDKKKLINFNVLKSVTNELGYRLSDEELTEILEKLQESSTIDVDKFVEIMNIVENNGFRKQK